MASYFIFCPCPWFVGLVARACLSPGLRAGVALQKWWRRVTSHIVCLGRSGSERVGECRGVAGGADELRDAPKPVGGGMVADLRHVVTGWEESCC